MQVVMDENGQREVCDLMLGQWAWDQSVSQLVFLLSQYIYCPGTYCQ